jgi:DNA polymerase III subunit epsilon
MNLSRPLIFFDLETTGVNTSTDRIIQLAGIKLMPDGTRDTRTMLINPTISIPREASEVHGITDEMVADQATFREISRELLEWMSECDLA